MARVSREIPPPLELLCLQVLWTLKEGAVKDVHEVVTETRPLAYTTIMTVLERLVKKGKLTRRKAGRAFIYAPQATCETLREAAVRELVENFFDGDQAALLHYLQPGRVRANAALAEDAQGNLDTELL